MPGWLFHCILDPTYQHPLPRKTKKPSNYQLFKAGDLQLLTCHGDLNCLWFFKTRSVFNTMISYLSSAEWHLFFIPSLTQLAGTLHFEFSFLDYKGARNLIQSIPKQAMTPDRGARNSSGACCLLGKEAHTVGTCPLALGSVWRRSRECHLW